MPDSVLLRSIEHPDPAAELLGRAGELALIGSLLAGLDPAAPGLLLRGGPGVGKTALLDVAAQLARHADLRVLRASGVECEAELPFSGLHQLLHPLQEHAAQLPSAQREALARAFGLAEGPAPSRFVISAAALGLVEAAAACGRVLLLVDDVQWLDRRSAEVLGFVARRLATQPAVLITAATTGFEDPIGHVGLTELEVLPLPAGVDLGLPRPRTGPQRTPDERAEDRPGVTVIAPARALPAGSGGLTAQELQIAGLAAGGLTNKQIAERLFLSHRTVGTHLYKIFPKLGISSRAALRDALGAGGHRVLAVHR